MLACAGIVASAAYAATGQLDTTFNTTGTVLLPSAGNDGANDVAIQPDGKIVVVGSTTTNAGDAMVWRYNTDGTPDLTFNAGGTPGSLSINLGGADAANAVALAPDNKIVVAGGSASAGFVARLNTNGTLDTTGFGSPNGYVLLSAAGGSETEYSVVVQPDSKIVTSGISSGGATIYRRDSAGAPDTSCNGVGGFKTLGASTFDGEDVGLQSNGDILVAGNTNPLVNGYVARLLGSNCSLDTGGYNSPNGIAILDSGGSEQVLGLAVQPDNKAVAVGFTSINNDAAVYRVNTNGTPDTSFDTDGAAGIDSGGTEQLQAVAVQPNGKIVVAGRTSVGTGDAAVYRLLANGGPGALNGALDPSFDTDGAIGVDISGSDNALGLALQPDGKAVVAGVASGAPPTGFLFRLQGDPPATPGTAPTTPKKKCKKGKKLKKVKGKFKCVKKKHKKH